MNSSMAFSAEEIRYLNLLSREYPTIEKASATLVNLNAVSNLPKGTEHFMSDLHGEAEAFAHILNNCSGVIREKVNDIFGDRMTEEERMDFCTLIYYPTEKIEELRNARRDTSEWYSRTIYNLVEVARSVGSKYTRAKVHNALPDDYSYIIDELLHTSGEEHDKEAYYRHIISTIISIDQGENYVVALATLIKRLAVDHLHVVGDLFDRGPHADRILNMLMEHHSVDIQWGNHDIVWMGAAAGSRECVAVVLNSALQYNTLSIVESAYGISLRDLIGYAQETYRESTWFMPRIPDDKYYVKNSNATLSKAHKAIAVIMFKLDGQIIARHPEYGMDDRRMLEKINYQKGTITIDGCEYALNDTQFPTVDPNDPYKLTDAEEDLIHSLTRAFRHSAALHRHIDFMYRNGSIYKTFNGNLLYHGCVPMREDGSFDAVKVWTGETLSGRSYMDFCDKAARAAFYDKDPNALDFMWYLWCGRKSPLFGRDRITTFERYFVSDKETWKEKKNPYYPLVENYGDVCNILHEFGLNEITGHLVNGHVPVKASSGESPIKANGRYLLIDGGFCTAYHDTTGIAGYTLIFTSKGLRLVAHSQFCGKRTAIRENRDILAATDVIFEMMNKRMLVRDTDEGKVFAERMYYLKRLIQAYREGVIHTSK